MRSSFFAASQILHFIRLFASDGAGIRWEDGSGSADSIFGFFFRILKAGEKRASDLLKEKEVELHRVRNIRLLFPAEFLMVAFVDFSLMTLWRAKVGTCARGI